MNSKLLINAIMRQTTILIAQLSTAAGIRAPLAHLADQVFLNLAKEIEAQGVGRKVVADMFGLALRSYQKKIQRLSESATASDCTLWEAVLNFLKDNQGVTRKQLFEHFKADEERHVAAVMNDLINSGLAYSTGRGDATFYGMTSEADQRRFLQQQNADAVAAMIWLTIYQKPQTLRELKLALPLGAEEVENAVKTLMGDGRISLDRDRRPFVLRAQTMVIPVGTEQGWEAAVFDHFRAVAKAIACKVRKGSTMSSQDDVIGGATLSFDLHPDHPYKLEVYGLLSRVREDINILWNKVSTHNRQHPIAEQDKSKVVFYFGQYVESSESELSGDP